MPPVLVLLALSTVINFCFLPVRNWIAFDIEMLIPRPCSFYNTTKRNNNNSARVSVHAVVNLPLHVYRNNHQLTLYRCEKREAIAAISSPTISAPVDPAEISESTRSLPADAFK